MLITKGFFLKDFGNKVHNLRRLVLIDLNLFLHETADFFPLFQLDVFCVREVSDQTFNADVKRIQGNLSNRVVFFETAF